MFKIFFLLITIINQLVGVPGMSGPMISQVGRNDPALMQYAMQSFGTINLSEEDWIKAEDHYKVIIN